MSGRRDRGKTGDRFKSKSALHARVRQMLVLERLCSRFHLVAEQLLSRHGDRETLRVEDEYDVRDLLHALLRLEHDDVRLETWMPGYEGGRARSDFVLKIERVVIVARKAGSDLVATRLDEQLSVDVEHYRNHPDCGTLVCFVYDPEGQMADAVQVENDLSGKKDGLSLRVVIAPKRL
jgi:hypothetical protein